MLNEIKIEVDTKNIIVRRGDIWIVDIPEFKDGEEVHRSLQKGLRPFLVTSNDVCNVKSSVVNGVILTSRETKAKIITHVQMGVECGLRYNSVALCEAPTSFDKVDFQRKVGECTEEIMLKIDFAQKTQNGTLPPFSMKTIEEKVFVIRKTKEMYDMCKHEDLYKMYRIGVQELRRYCNDYLKDYTRYYNDKNDNNTQIACAI